MPESLTQCDLRSGTWHTTAWIPTKSAAIGETVRFKDDDRHWIVTKTYQTAEKRHVNDAQHHASDVWNATSGKNPIGHK